MKALRLRLHSVRVRVFIKVVLPLDVGMDVHALVAHIRPEEPSNIPSLPAVEVYHTP